MTEPDEALLYVREHWATICDEDGFPDEAQCYRRGDNDQALVNDADFYRAGQAASAERIKALEELLNHTEDLFDWAAQSDCENGVRSLNEAAATKYLADAPATKAAILEIRELTRNLLKEADQ